MKQKRQNLSCFHQYGIGLFITLLATILFACGSGSSPESNQSPAPSPTVKKSESEEILQSFATANFDYIYEIRSKSGEALTSEDIKYISERTTQVNRRRKTDDNKAVFIGTNFDLDSTTLVDFKQRFDFDDHSRSAAEIEARKKAKQNSNKE
ncbi:MAG: hypothetical protein ACK5NT_08120 [Pyrinomonadaceae bacterium]